MVATSCSDSAAAVYVILVQLIAKIRGGPRGMVSALPSSGQSFDVECVYIGADYMQRQGGHSRLCPLDYVHLAKGYVHPGFETIGDE